MAIVGPYIVICAQACNHADVLVYIHNSLLVAAAFIRLVPPWTSAKRWFYVGQTCGFQKAYIHTYHLPGISIVMYQYLHVVLCRITLYTTQTYLTSSFSKIVLLFKFSKKVCFLRHSQVEIHLFLKSVIHSSIIK